jgi:hypothetical protein
MWIGTGENRVGSQRRERERFIEIGLSYIRVGFGSPIIDKDEKPEHVKTLQLISVLIVLSLV